jgi:hypothetical protein
MCATGGVCADRGWGSARAARNEYKIDIKQQQQG